MAEDTFQETQVAILDKAAIGARVRVSVRVRVLGGW